MSQGKILRSASFRSTPIFACLFTAAVLGLIPAGAHAPLGEGDLLTPPMAEAQNFGHRVVQGTVVDGDKPIAGATIFLKNLKSRDLKSYTSIADGSFRFAQVGMIDDYEVWAEQGKRKSAVRTISSFDSRKQLDFELKLK